MGWASQKMLEDETRYQRAMRDLPERLDESLALTETLQQEVQNLKRQMTAQNSVWERSKDYVAGGIVGALISMVLAAML